MTESLKDWMRNTLEDIILHVKEDSLGRGNVKKLWSLSKGAAAGKLVRIFSGDGKFARDPPISDIINNRIEDSSLYDEFRNAVKTIRGLKGMPAQLQEENILSVDK